MQTDYSHVLSVGSLNGSAVFRLIATAMEAIAEEG